MQRVRLNIGTTLRVTSLALALGMLASPAAAQPTGWNGGYSATGSGGGAGGESGSGSATETVMPYERETSGRALTGRAYRGNDGRSYGNTGRGYRGYDDVDTWNDGYRR